LSGGDDLHKSGVVAPQHPPKDPSVNQACGYVQPSSEEGLMWSKYNRKIGGKVHNTNITYKVSHVNTQAITLDRSQKISSSNFTLAYKVIQFLKSRYGRIIITHYYPNQEVCPKEPIREYVQQ
jgi:hypothetical protein